MYRFFVEFWGKMSFSWKNPQGVCGKLLRGGGKSPSPLEFKFFLGVCVCVFGVGWISPLYAHLWFEVACQISCRMVVYLVPKVFGSFLWDPNCNNRLISNSPWSRIRFDARAVKRIRGCVSNFILVVVYLVHNFFGSFLWDPNCNNCWVWKLSVSTHMLSQL